MTPARNRVCYALAAYMRALLAKRFELFSLFALCVVASLPSEVGAQMPTRVVVENGATRVTVICREWKHAS